MSESSNFQLERYSAKKLEDKWTNCIIESNSNSNSDKSYSISIPPPNVTGNLHLGHALNTTIQDIFIKFYSLKGLDTSWALGTDHAGIATQLLVEKSLVKKGIDSKALKRDELLSHIWKWKDENGEDILNQLKVLGLNCNWDNPKFTLDDDMSKAVNEAFIRLYDKGLIYQEKTLINWDPKLKTAISDLEVISQKKKSSLYYFKYFLDNSDSFIIVSTTRPETVFGDVAVAINPKDEKNIKFAGMVIKSPFNNRSIKIIVDEYADLTKGSGAVKITPAHDFNDYDIAIKHNLPFINILNDDGTLNDDVPKNFRNLKTIDAREKVLAFMSDIDIFVKEEKIDNTIPVGDRSGEVVEPLLKNQWFLDVKEMANKSSSAVEKGEVEFKPKFWENTFFEWMNKIQPWCISRQIIWGHRIPVWHSDDNRSVAAHNLDEAKVKFLEKYQEKKELNQDPDVLDTWFSSSLWPFSTLGWPNETIEYKRYFPTSLLVTGFDIIFFWVARMIMMSLELTGQIPFKLVYIHNLIRDKKGDKMSKTKGNVINPLDLIEEYGTDSLRLFLSSNISPHSDIKLSPNSLDPYKNFMNKIWNAAKFINLNFESEGNSKEDSFFDAWICNEFNILLDNYSQHIENCEVEKASYELYHFFWDDFCDWYIEIAKISYLNNKDDELLNTKFRMKQVFCMYLNLLYPFAPFISLELHDVLNKDGKGNKFNTLPKKLEFNYSEDFNKQIKQIKELTIGIRSLRKNLEIKPNEKIKSYYSLSTSNDELSNESKNLISGLCNLESLNLLDDNSQNPLISNVTPSGTVAFLKTNNVDFSVQIKKLNKDLLSLQKILELSNSKLKNKGFLDSAPINIVSEEKNKVKETILLIEEVKNLIAQLK